MSFEPKEIAFGRLAYYLGLRETKHNFNFYLSHITNAFCMNSKNTKPITLQLSKKNREIVTALSIDGMIKKHLTLLSFNVHPSNPVFYVPI
jgi:hypothetical protein